MSTRLRPTVLLATAALALSGAAALPSAASAYTLPATDPYVSFRDSFCYLSFQYIFPLWRYTQPTVSLVNFTTDGSTPPVRLDATATKDGKVIASASITQVNGTKNLDAGRFGGWTLGVKVTRKDGSVLTDSSVIASHPSPDCTIN
ncbi:MAG: hypothetical protein AAGC46_21605 [Solirubrobacteraceae bacterium]